MLLPQDADPAARGPACLDGSPPAIYVRAGAGADASKLVLFWEGGGWCWSLADCLARAATPLGSSASYPAEATGYADRDVLLPDCAVNPAFCNYSSVYAPYCDGASRASRVAGTVTAPGSAVPLFLRGADNFVATLAALAAPGGPGGGVPPLGALTDVLVTGSSAGGLTTLLHLDAVAAAARAANPAVRVAGVPEVGFFLDAQSIWGGERVARAAFAAVAAMGNVSAGGPGQGNAACAAATPMAERWRCFMAPYVYPYVATPTFLLQSSLDEYQTQNLLAPNRDIALALTPYAPFLPCTLHPGPAPDEGACNASQWLEWFSYDGQFYDALDAALAATPPAVLALSGGVLTTCPIHTTAIGGRSHAIVVAGKTMYDYLAEWWAARGGGEPVRGGRWARDVPFPGDASCPKPSAALDREGTWVGAGGG